MGQGRGIEGEDEWTVDDGDVTVITDPGTDFAPDIISEEQLNDVAQFDVVFTNANNTSTDLPLPPLPGVPHIAPHAAPHSPTKDSIERWTTALVALESEAKAQQDGEKAALLHLEMGRINEERLGHGKLAAQHYQHAFQLAPKNHAVLHAAIRLFTQGHVWPMAVQLMQALADATDDKHQKAGVLAGRATVYLEKLRENENAVTAFRAALEAWPAEPLAIASLEQILTAQADFSSLLAVYTQAIAADAYARRPGLLLKAARMCEDRLRNWEQAAVFYKELLQLDPLHPVALPALRRLYAVNGRHNELVELLTHAAVVAQVPEDSATFLLDAAHVLQHELAQPAKALNAVQAALQSSPENARLWDALHALHKQAGNREEAANVLGKRASLCLDAAARAAMLCELGAEREAQNSPVSAMAAYRQALQAVPEHPPSVKALIRLMETQGPWEELALLLRADATQEPHKEQKAARLMQLAELLFQRLQRPDDAVAALREALEIQRSHTVALEMLERILRQEHQYEPLAALYEQKILATDAREQRVVLLCRLAELHEERLNNPAAALDVYQRVIDVAPDHVDSLRAMARLQEKRGRWVDVIKALELEVAATQDRKARAPTLLRMAWIHESQLKDDSSAVTTLEKLLMMAPGNVPALRALQRLYERQSRWPELVGAIRKELEGQRALEDGVVLLMRMADVALNKQKDPDNALRFYREVLERAPKDPAALDALAALYAQRDEPDPQAQTLLRAAAALPPGPSRHTRLLEAARLYDRRLKRPERAVELWEEVLRDGAATPAAVDGLLTVLGNDGRWQELLTALKAGADATTDKAARAALLARCAQIARDRLVRPDVAAENLQAALLLTPQDDSLLQQLEGVLVHQRQWDKALQTSARRADLPMEAQDYAALLLRMAAIREDVGIAPEIAAQHHHDVLTRVADHPVAWRGLELHLLKAGASEGVMQLYVRQAALTPHPELRANLLFRAADLAEMPLHRDHLAEAFYKAALDAQPAHLPSLQGRRRVAQRAQNHAVLLECALAEAAVVANPERKTTLLYDAGVLCMDHLGDPVRAIRYFRDVMERGPTHKGAYDRLVRAYQTAGDYQRMIDVVTTRASAVTQPEEQAALYLEGAMAAQHQAGDLHRAMELYREVLTRLPHHAGALQAHAPLLFQHSVWDEAVEVLHRLVTVTKDESILNNAWRMLGIIFQEHRRDAGRAVSSFEAALTVNPRDQESLLRCAAVHREEGSALLAVAALERLVRIQGEPARRVHTFMELAELYAGPVNQPDRAVQALVEALGNVPNHAAAMTRLDALLDKLGRHQQLAQMLIAFITSVEAVDHMAAVPWQMRLANIQEANLQDDGAALDELLHVVDVNPAHEQALAAMARIYARSSVSRPRAIETHRKLLRLDPFRVESHHHLFQLFGAAGEGDKAFVMAEVLVFLKSATQEEDLFFHSHKASIPPHASALLTPQEYEKWVVHPDENTTARALLSVVASQLHDVFPGDLKRYNLERRDRHTIKSDLPLRKTADSLATVLMAPEFDLWLSTKLETGIFLENRDPPSLVVAEATARRVQEKELRFLLARQLESIKAMHHVLEKLEPNVVEHLLYALARIANPEGPPPREIYEVEAMQKKVLKAIPRGARKQLEELQGRAVGVRTFDGLRQQQAGAHTVNRAGLVVTHDVEVAVRAVFRELGGEPRAVFADASQARVLLGRQPQVTELLHYVTTEDYFSARRRMGFSIS